ncbi:MAG: hypothetical protein R3330_05940, partial [Saprospiraceae bacterium]|nr:hypothetical protein [Saprospiraceae bacterium]
YLYMDTNGDGDEDGSPIDSTFTNASGVFTFTGVEPGVYVLVEEQPFLHNSLSDYDTSTAGADTDGDDLSDGPDNDIPVVVVPGEDDEDNDFVNGRPGIICGNVSDDTGAPIGSVIIDLYADTDGDGNADGAPIATTISDSDSGNFCFEDITPGDYVLVETHPLNYDSVSDIDTSITALDLDGDDGAVPDDDIPVTLSPGETDADNNFVEDPHVGSISGMVMNDLSAPMENIMVELYGDSDGDGNPDGPALTNAISDATGMFYFTGVEPGMYCIVEMHPANYSSISDYDDTPDPDGDDSSEGPDNDIPVTVDPGEADDDNNFMNGRPGSICGAVTDDLGNPLDAVVILLYADVDSNGIADGPPVAITSTEASAGAYCFDSLVPMAYVVIEQQPLDYGELDDYDRTVDVNDPDGDDQIDGPDNDIPVILAPGEADEDNDFRDVLCPDLPQITGDTTFVICDGMAIEFEAQNQQLGTETYTWNFGDGATPATATGVGPHTVTYDTTAINQLETYVTLQIAKDGCPPVEDTVANVIVHPYPDATILFAAGNTGGDNCWMVPHTFQPLAPEIPGATYTWDFGPYATPSTATGYGPHEVEFDSAGTWTVSLLIDPNFPVTSCPDSSTFEVDIIECYGNISGVVKTDEDDPIGNVLITLYTDNDSDGVPDAGPPLGFTFTTANGNYAFTVLDPGNYVVQEFQPSGYLNLYDVDESPDGDDVPNTDQTDDLIPVTVGALVTDSDNNFVETVELGMITGTVFEDLDGDEEPDAGEGIDSVWIMLFDDVDKDGVPDGPNPVDSAMTDTSGFYMIENVS